MVTTIQLNNSVKNLLDNMKTGKETYEDVILRIVKQVEETKRKRKNLLLEGYQEMADENLKIAKEFESFDNKWEW